MAFAFAAQGSPARIARHGNGSATPPTRRSAGADRMHRIAVPTRTMRLGLLLLALVHAQHDNAKWLDNLEQLAVFVG